MNIALIKPSLGEKNGKPYRTPAVMEPLIFAIISGLTPPDIRLSLYDERFEEIPFDAPFDLVAITVETFTARRAYQISRKFRDRGIKVILGGFHPTLLPDEAAQYADSIAIGPAEGVWTRILGDLGKGRIESRYDGFHDPGFKFAPPDKTVFSGKSYLPLAMLETSRGCRHRCDFCAVRNFYRDTLEFKPPKQVLEEIEKAGKKFIFFVDDNIIANPGRAKTLFRELKALNIRWVSQASLETAFDPEMLDLMTESGCFSLILGLESLSSENLKQMKKGWTLAFGGPAKALEAFRERGILIYATFVFGYDHDTPSSFSETVEFAISRKLFLANFNILQPFPGTELYTGLARENRLLYPKWWLEPAYQWNQPAFRPRNLSVDQLADGIASARRRFNSLSGILRRSMDFRANLADPFRALVFFAGNLISRRDIARKQQLTLGFSGDHHG